jgi:hypothetical protein
VQGTAGVVIPRNDASSGVPRAGLISEEIILG